jgi:hypothetical protein
VLAARRQAIVNERVPGTATRRRRRNVVLGRCDTLQMNDELIVAEDRAVSFS